MDMIIFYDCLTFPYNSKQLHNNYYLFLFSTPAPLIPTLQNILIKYTIYD